MCTAAPSIYTYITEDSAGVSELSEEGVFCGRERVVVRLVFRLLVVLPVFHLWMETKPKINKPVYGHCEAVGMVLGDGCVCAGVCVCVQPCVCVRVCVRACVWEREGVSVM